MTSPTTPALPFSGLIDEVEVFNRTLAASEIQAIYNAGAEGKCKPGIHKVYLPLTLRNYCADFFDDFSNPASGWFTIDSNLRRVEYLNGEYRVLSKQPGYLFLFRAPTCARENYTVEADVRWDTNTGSDVGLLFGGDTGAFQRFYFFDINPDYQAYALYRFEPDSIITIASPAQSLVIQPGTSSNHLKVTRNGGQITLEINGATLGSWYDTAISGLTFTGLASAPYDNYPTSDARFDNFRVQSLSGTGGLALTASQIANSPFAVPGQPSSWTPNLNALREATP